MAIEERQDNTRNTRAEITAMRKAEDAEARSSYISFMKQYLRNNNWERLNGRSLSTLTPKEITIAFNNLRAQTSKQARVGTAPNYTLEQRKKRQKAAQVALEREREIKGLQEKVEPTLKATVGRIPVFGDMMTMALGRRYRNLGRPDLGEPLETQGAISGTMNVFALPFFFSKQGATSLVGSYLGETAGGVVGDAYGNPEAGRAIGALTGGFSPQIWNGTRQLYSSYGPRFSEGWVRFGDNAAREYRIIPYGTYGGFPIGRVQSRQYSGAVQRNPNFSPHRRPRPEQFEFWPEVQRIDPAHQGLIKAWAEHNNIDLSGINIDRFYRSIREGNKSQGKFVDTPLGLTVGYIGSSDPGLNDITYRLGRILEHKNPLNPNSPAFDVFDALGVKGATDFGHSISSARALAADVRAQLWNSGILTKEHLAHPETFKLTPNNLLRYLQNAHGGQYLNNPNLKILGIERGPVGKLKSGKIVYGLKWINPDDAEYITRNWKDAILSFKNGSKLTQKHK